MCCSAGAAAGEGAVQSAEAAGKDPAAGTAPHRARDESAANSRGRMVPLVCELSALLSFISGLVHASPPPQEK